jgi:hypothetical protein
MGAETAARFRLLTEFGCGFRQGVFSKPAAGIAEKLFGTAFASGISSLAPNDAPTFHN